LEEYKHPPVHAVHLSFIVKFAVKGCVVMRRGSPGILQVNSYYEVQSVLVVVLGRVRAMV
jgi:hypothetical protein